MVEPMNKKYIIIPYIITVLLLGLMVIVGAVNTFQLYQKYGFSYEVITIINEVETREIMNVYNNMTALFFIIWILILLLVSLWSIQQT